MLTLSAASASLRRRCDAPAAHQLVFVDVVHGRLLLPWSVPPAVRPVVVDLVLGLVGQIVKQQLVARPRRELQARLGLLGDWASLRLHLLEQLLLLL